MHPGDDAGTPRIDSADSTERSARLERLAEAVDVYLDFAGQEERESADELFSRHEPLRELLEPMVAEITGAVVASPVTAAPSGPTPEAGQCLDDYRILRELGRGGMGIVFEAEQISLRRRVALKLLHEHLTGSTAAIERFRREAAAASQLQHPGIVPIHEVGEWRGRHYFTMELLDGQPLHDTMNRPRLGVRADCSRAAEAAELVARVADALHHAHERGLIHRDVKPQNIMVGADGSVRLLDFGLVKSVAAGGDSLTGGFLGTPHYSSPEQAAGEQLGPTTDVFSLGVVLYELLAGRRPFVGDTAREVLDRIESGLHEPLAKSAPRQPRDLRTICEKALELQPRNRYESAAAMSADLRRFLRIEPILATPPSAIERCGKWVRRHRVRVALTAAAALLTVGAPLGWAAHEYHTRLVVERERARLESAEGLAFRSIVHSLNALAENLAREPGPGSRKQPRVDQVVRHCEDYLDMRKHDPERGLQVAQAYRLVADINVQLGNLEGALRANRRAESLIPTAEASAVRAAERDNLVGQLLRQRMRIRLHQDPESGSAEFERVLDHWREQVERPDATTAAIVEYCSTLVGRARSLTDITARRVEAEHMLRAGLALLTADRRRESPRAEAVAIAATCGLGELLLAVGRPKAALPMFQQAIDSTAGEAVGPTLGIERTLALAGAGEAQRRLGDPKMASEMLRRAIDLGVAFTREFPGARALGRALRRSRMRLASVHLMRGQFADAEKLLRETAAELPDVDVMTWRDRALQADIHGQLAAAILMGPGGAEREEARELLRSVCDLLQQLTVEQPGQFEFRLELGGTWNNLAALANERREHAEARDCARRAIAAQEVAVEQAPSDPRPRLFLGMHFSQLAFAMAHLGEPGAAVAAAEKAAGHAPQHTATLRLAAEAATIAANATGEREHGRVAVQALSRVADVSSSEARQLLADPRFDAIRDRDDFEALEQRVVGR